MSPCNPRGTRRAPAARKSCTDMHACARMCARGGARHACATEQIRTTIRNLAAAPDQRTRL
eukprot:7301941-Alexandrium_andersonii.AAC.1